jgi:hypothetical protein
LGEVARILWPSSRFDGNLLAAKQEDVMAKGQIKGNKEAKKPKAEKPKSSVSAYKASQGKGGAPISTPGKKG